MRTYKSCPSLCINILLMILTSACNSNASSSSNLNSISPVNNLETALKASAAHGTIVAIKATYQDSQPCVVLISKSTSPQLSSQSVQSEKNDDLLKKIHDLENAPALSEGPFIPFQKINTSPMLHILRTNYNHNHIAVIGITGFAPDAQHIVNHAVQSLSNFKYIYAGSGSSKAALSVIKRRIVDPISTRLRSAAFSDNGRPFGVQALIVGGTPLSDTQKSNPVCLYSVDPSGGWRFWGGDATAIGKHAESTRKSLWIQLSRLSNESVDVEKALEIAMKALLIPDQSDFTNSNSDPISENKYSDVEVSETDLDQLDTIVILLGSKPKCIALDSNILHSVYRKCFSTIDSNMN